VAAVGASTARDYLESIVGRPPHQRAVARDAVTASAIRTWCDAMGERNPVYLDPAAARAALLVVRSAPALPRGPGHDADAGFVGRPGN